MSKKLLVTGSGGYIGSIATRAFLREGYQVIGIDSLSRGYTQPQEQLQSEFGNDQFKFHKADIRDDLYTLLKDEGDFDAVVHFAALCNVGESEINPSLYFENNVRGVSTLLESMRKLNIGKLLFSSTCATYGSPDYTPIDEKHNQNKCTSVYGETKAMAEKTISWYSKLFGIEYTFLRYFNICGASDDSVFGDSKKPSFHLMQNAIRAALALSKFELNYTKVDTPDGSPIRDYINVEDLSEAHVKALRYMESNKGNEIFNLGTGKGNSVHEIITAVEKLTNAAFEKNVSARRKGDPTRAVADNQKAKQLLDWSPSRSIEHSIETLIKWYQQRPCGWEY